VDDVLEDSDVLDEDFSELDEESLDVDADELEDEEPLPGELDPLLRA